MNFLQLVQRLASECGVPTSNLTTAESQTGEAGRLVNWVNAAWLDIQTAHRDWDWMRASASWTTVNTQAEYTTTECGIAAGTFGFWERNSFRCYSTSAGFGSEMFLRYLPYDEWRNQYKFGSFQTTYSRPMDVSITPSKGIALGPYPTDGFTIRGDYFTAPSEMSDDADTPSLPTQFHLAIVYRAMMFYAGFESAPEVYQRGEFEFGKLMRRMEQDRLREVAFVGALA